MNLGQLTAILCAARNRKPKIVLALFMQVFIVLIMYLWSWWVYS